jgi:hypothetical protein
MRQMFTMEMSTNIYIYFMRILSTIRQSILLQILSKQGKKHKIFHNVNELIKKLNF